MTEKAPVRPVQTTLSAWMIMGGSVLVVLLAYQQVAGLSTLESQDRIADVLAEPPGDGLGLTVSQYEGFIRAMCFVAAGCAAAAGILGWQVLQRSRTAMIVLTVLAVPLFVSGFAVTGFASALVAGASGLLWLQPSRGWLTGKQPDTAPAVSPPAAPTWDHGAMSESGSNPYGQPSNPSGQTPSGQNPSGQNPYGGQSPYGSSPYPQSSESSPYGQAPYGQTPYGGAAADPGKRPGTVMGAGITTIVLSAISTLLFGGLTLVLLVARGDVIDSIDDELRRQGTDLDGFSTSDLTTVIIVVVLVLAIWSLIATVLGALVLRGANWARITLVVSAVFAALFSLLSITSLVSLVPLVGSIAVIVMLFTGGANEWFRAKKNARA